MAPVFFDLTIILSFRLIKDDLAAGRLKTKRYVDLSAQGFPNLILCRGGNKEQQESPPPRSGDLAAYGPGVACSVIERVQIRIGLNVALL